MSDPSPPPDPIDAEPADEARSPWALVAQFFVIPLGVVLLAVGVFVAFGLVTDERRKPEEALDEVRTGSLNRRWQAAFELATELAKNPETARDDALFRKTLSTFESSQEDARIRRYLALALGRFGRPEAVPALGRALVEPDEETRVYAALALGSIRDPAVLPPLLGALRSEEPALRKVAAFALGQAGSAEAVEPLGQLIEDRRFDVALQASLSLAQLNSPMGLATLRRALDRQRIDAVPEMESEDQRAEAMVNALRGLLLLGDRDSLERLEELARSDPSLKVRDAALKGIEVLEKGSRIQ